MASTWVTTQADPCFDGEVAPMVADPFIDVEQAIARLIHASHPPDARGGGPAPDRSADAPISQSFAAGTLGAADLRPPISREQRPLGKRDTLARVAIAVWLGASAIWAWQSYGRPATDIIAPPAPQTPNAVPEQAAVEQLAAGQARSTCKIAKLQAEKPQADEPQVEQPDKRVLGRVSAAPTAIPSGRKPAPITPVPPQAARRVSTVTALSRPPRSGPQMTTKTQNAILPPLRPPIPVPQQ
jgi:hypothetical protein